MFEKDTCRGVFAPSPPYTPQYFLHPDQLIHGGKPINALFDEFKGEDTFFVSEWLRQKGQEKLCEV